MKRRAVLAAIAVIALAAFGIGWLAKPSQTPPPPTTVPPTMAPTKTTPPATTTPPPLPTTPPPDFTMTISPNKNTIQEGEHASYTIFIEPTGGFSAEVAITDVSGLPSDASYLIIPGTDVKNVLVTAGNITGSFDIVVTGRGGGKTHTANCKLVIQATPWICDETWTGNKTYVVTDVIDGDTIAVDNCTVRLALVDAPEVGESGYWDARLFTRDLCEIGSVVIVDQDDGQPHDTYGRIVAVVYAKGKCVNGELLYHGFATILTEYCDVSEFSDEDWAQEHGCGPPPTTPPPTTTGCIVVSYFHYDAQGNDNYPENLNDEYVVLKNTCSYSIDMTNWRVTDSGAKHTYTFPSFTLAGGSTMTLHSGQGTNTKSDLYWGRSYGAVWNNDGDALYLYDATGSLVLRKGYSG